MPTVSKARVPPEIQSKPVWQESDRGAKIFAGLLHDRIWRENKNFIVAIVGDFGSGKSYTAMSLAEMIDPEFNIDKVVFKPREFFEKLGKAKSGDVIVFDEAGVGIPSRDWQTIQNKMMSYVVQVFRHRKVGLIMTTPSMNYIDKQIRIACHYAIKVHGIDYSTKSTWATIYERLHDYVRDITSWEKWKIKEDTREVEFNPVYFKKPSDSLCEEYEKRSRERKSQVERDALDTMEMVEKGLNVPGYDGKTVRKMYNFCMASYNLIDYLMTKEGWGIVAVARAMGVSSPTLRYWLDWAKSEKEKDKDILIQEEERDSNSNLIQNEDD